MHNGQSYRTTKELRSESTQISKPATHFLFCEANSAVGLYDVEIHYKYV